MINLQTNSDKMAIGLSALCTIHCLVLPLLTVLIPSIAALPLQDEAFHIWMVVAVVPISLFALSMGCKKHKNFSMLFIGAVGLIILSVAAFFGHDLLGEELEKVFTVIGASIIAIVHIWNYRLCQKQLVCEC
ncbi:MAG: MerC domain-containing protein [Pseudomonadota bacterium]